MALKINSKKARENIRAYMVRECHFSDSDTFTDIAHRVWQEVKEYRERDIRFNPRRYYNPSMFWWFKEWVETIPSACDLPFLYQVKARTILGDILEQSPEEREKYFMDDAGVSFDRANAFNERMEAQAEEKLLAMIFREIEKEVQ